MCTVSFIPVKNTWYLTSNRDEKFSRQKAIPPDFYCTEGGRLLFPKDADASGSWIALHENGNAAVLLNGAFIKHIPQPPYNKSRGIILLEIISAAMPATHFHKITLDSIEPFTVIIMENDNLYECRWDGAKKHFRQLETHCSYIWSSATLYNGLVTKRREKWFAAFLNKNPAPAIEKILQFHQFSGSGDLDNGLKMNRNGLMSTVSITSIQMNRRDGSMFYTDLKDDKKYWQKMEFTSLAAST